MAESFDTAIPRLAAVADTIRWMATGTLGDNELWADDLIAAADLIERSTPADLAGSTCPLCEEEACDEGCPLSSVRGDGGHVANTDLGTCSCGAPVTRRFFSNEQRRCDRCFEEKFWSTHERCHCGCKRAYRRF